MNQDFCHRCYRVCSIQWQVDPALEERVLRATKYTQATLCLECFADIAKHIRVPLKLEDFLVLKFYGLPLVGVGV